VRLGIVEDEIILTMALTLMLEGWGHDVVGAADDEAGAVALVRSSRPQALLMDVRLGRQESGLEAGRRIRRESDIPLLFVTANADGPAVRAEVLALGNAHLLAKPVDEEQLERLLRAIEQLEALR
jgi:CheY-like chemotaxis protein